MIPGRIVSECRRAAMRPDATPGVALGFRRLSIIDLECASQPLSNEDGSVWVVFNGEIYNFAALRHRLEGAGHVFRTHGDGETIVHLYEDVGVDCFSHLNGMFAIAIWDARKRQLVLGRDRLGQKPLVYRCEAGSAAVCQRTEEPAAGAGRASRDRSRRRSIST